MYPGSKSIDFAPQDVRLGLQPGLLDAQVIELGLGIYPGLGRTVGPIAGVLNLAGGLGRGFVARLGACSRPRKGEEHGQGNEKCRCGAVNGGSPHGGRNAI